VDVSDYFVIYANPFLVIVISDDHANASPFLDQASSIMAKLFSHVQVGERLMDRENDWSTDII